MPAGPDRMPVANASARDREISTVRSAIPRRGRYSCGSVHSFFFRGRLQRLRPRKKTNRLS